MSNSPMTRAVQQTVPVLLLEPFLPIVSGPSNPGRSPARVQVSTHNTPSGVRGAEANPEGGGATRSQWTSLRSGVTSFTLHVGRAGSIIGLESRNQRPKETAHRRGHHKPRHVYYHVCEMNTAIHTRPRRWWLRLIGRSNIDKVGTRYLTLNRTTHSWYITHPTKGNWTPGPTGASRSPITLTKPPVIIILIMDAPPSLSLVFWFSYRVH